MVPSRLAFLQEFERELSSTPLRAWFEGARKREPVLAEFIDPATLRGFLQADDHDPRKPQIWRALVRSFRTQQETASLFLLGLLEPALGHLIDKVDECDLDPEDLWQETVACALQALGNPQLPNRRVVLLGLVRDTQKLLGASLRRELTEATGEAGLLDLAIDANLDGPDSEFALAVWCRRAGVKARDEQLIRATRIQRIQLSQLAAHGSPAYNRLKLRRYRAERRLESWLRTRFPKASKNSM
jgi:hypothetical protein